MAGENPEDPRSGQPDEFLSKTKWQRFQILFAGPAMNIILAVVVTAFVLATGRAGRRSTGMSPRSSVGGRRIRRPRKRDLRRGDRILTVAGDTVDTWKDLDIAIGTAAESRHQRDACSGMARRSPTTVRPVAEGRYEISDIGVLPDVNPVITQCHSGDRAEQAGLKAGDIILSVNGERMATRAQLIEVISQSGGKTIQLTVRRGTEDVTLHRARRSSAARAA